MISSDTVPKSAEYSSRLASQPRAKATFAFVSLGCPKNLVDSERMLAVMQQGQFELVREPAGADLVVINTCGFIERARDESLGVIHEMLALKREGQVRGVLVAGCLAERQKDALLEQYPEIDAVLGVFGREEIARAAGRFVEGLDEQRSLFQPAPVRALSDRHRFRITPPHMAYLKISEGCDRLCTFCAIPKMRGTHASKPMEDIVLEAEELATGGAREIIIVAQDTTYYGLDIYGQPMLAELLQRLEEVQGIDWIRLMYLYPMYFGEELIERIAASRKILPYLDIPLQHIDDVMLRRMARRVNRRDTEALLDRLRRAMPELVLRTTFITGFPGETEEQFEELVRFTREWRFERMGVFTYSDEPDTPAARLRPSVPPEEREQRRERLMEVQQEIAFQWNQRQVGRRLDVLLDVPLPEEKNVWIGRTYADAPDVDAAVYVTGPGLRAGQIVPCEVVAFQEYDLIAAPVGEPR